MLPKIIIATHNNHKLEEFRTLFNGFTVLSFADLGIDQEVVEDGETYIENAYKKIMSLEGYDDYVIVGDDSGIEINALDGGPGLFSARYYHQQSHPLQTIYEACVERGDFGATFVSCLAMRYRGQNYHSLQRVEGYIVAEAGQNGFAYDKVFHYPVLHKTFGEMTSKEKLQHSPRALAARELKNIIFREHRFLNIVLYQPEIPQNTGNIMRTCSAFQGNLHLIKPLGFSLEHKDFKRSAMDYLFDVGVFVYESWEDFVSQNGDQELYMVTRYGQHTPDQVTWELQKPLFLVFGSESQGIDLALLRDNYDRCVRVPMQAQARSLNLSNTVAIMVYEVYRQHQYQGLSVDEVLKGKDFIWKESEK